MWSKLAKKLSKNTQSFFQKVCLHEISENLEFLLKLSKDTLSALKTVKLAAESC